MQQAIQLSLDSFIDQLERDNNFEPIFKMIAFKNLIWSLDN